MVPIVTISNCSCKTPVEGLVTLNIQNSRKHNHEKASFARCLQLCPKILGLIWWPRLDLQEAQNMNC